MVNLKISYNTDSGTHHSLIQVNEISLIKRFGIFKDEVLVPCNLGESITIKLKNHLLVENETVTKNPFKIIASVVIMFFIAGISVSIYDFDCWDYHTEIILKTTSTTPSVIIKVSEQEAHKQSTFDVVGNGCEVIFQKTKTEVNKDYVSARFKEYLRFNFLRTVFLCVIFLSVSIIGIITKQITTVIFPAFLVALFVLMYFYSKKQLKRMERQFLEM